VAPGQPAGQRESRRENAAATGSWVIITTVCPNPRLTLGLMAQVSRHGLARLILGSGRGRHAGGLTVVVWSRPPGCWSRGARTAVRKGGRRAAVSAAGRGQQ